MVRRPDPKEKGARGDRTTDPSPRPDQHRPDLHFRSSRHARANSSRPFRENRLPERERICGFPPAGRPRSAHPEAGARAAPASPPEVVGRVGGFRRRRRPMTRTGSTRAGRPMRSTQVRAAELFGGLPADQKGAAPKWTAHPDRARERARRGTAERSRPTASSAHPMRALPVSTDGVCSLNHSAPLVSAPESSEGSCGERGMVRSR